MSTENHTGGQPAKPANATVGLPAGAPPARHPMAQAHRAPWQRIMMRPDVLAGLMFIAIAALGLIVSWNYPIGTAVRMGTGYVPRLMCWVLLALGIAVVVMGFLEPDETSADPPLQWRPLVLIPASLVVFALGIDRLGFVISGLLMLAIAGLASRESKALEVVIAAVLLVFFTWAIFVWALGLTFPVWPET